MKRILGVAGITSLGALVLVLGSNAPAVPPEGTPGPATGVASLCHFGGKATQAERVASGDVGVAIVVSSRVANAHRKHGDCSLSCSVLNDRPCAEFIGEDPDPHCICVENPNFED